MRLLNIIKFIALILPLCSFGQVGIGVENPTRMLEVNGNLKIRDLQNKTSNTDLSYKNILVVKEDETVNSVPKINGEVDKITFPAILQSQSNNVEVSKNIYISNTPDNTKATSCGEITFRLNINSSNNYISEFKLNSQEVFTTPKNDAKSISIQYGMRTFEGGFSYKNSPAVNINKATYDQYNQLDSYSSKTNSSIRIYTIVLPNLNNLYRITVSRFKNTSANTINSLVCEKFYIQTLE